MSQYDLEQREYFQPYRWLKKTSIYDKSVRIIQCRTTYAKHEETAITKLEKQTNEERSTQKI